MVQHKLSGLHQEKSKEDIPKKESNYVQFKENYSTEPYVSFNLKRGQRSLCAQLRAGVLPLAVEVGRYSGTPEEQRVCALCDLGVVEDEYHFVFYCPLYHKPRVKLFEKIQNKNPDLFWMSESHMLNWLFSNEVFALGKYMERAWQLRWKSLYP